MEREKPSRQSLLLLRWKPAFLTLLNIVLSALLVAANYPRRIWHLGACIGTISLVSLFLRCGWVVPCTIAGVYVGLANDANIKGGSHESQMWETVTSIAVGTFIGFGLGLLFDEVRRNKSRQ